MMSASVDPRVVSVYFDAGVSLSFYFIRREQHKNCWETGI